MRLDRWKNRSLHHSPVLQPKPRHICFVKSVKEAERQISRRRSRRKWKSSGAEKQRTRSEQTLGMSKGSPGGWKMAWNCEQRCKDHEQRFILFSTSTEHEAEASLRTTQEIPVPLWIAALLGGQTLPAGRLPPSWERTANYSPSFEELTLLEKRESRRSHAARVNSTTFFPAPSCEQDGFSLLLPW